MAASVLKRNARPGDEISHGARDQNLAGACLTGNASSDMDSDSSDLLADDLTLA